MTAPGNGPARRYRPLAALLAASWISLTGTRISMIAVPWLVLQSTGSPARTGIVAFAEMAPYVVVKALCGPVIDRYGPRRVSVIANAGSAVLVALVPLLHGIGSLHFATLVVVVSGVGTLSGPAGTAEYTLTASVSEHGKIPLERVTGLSDGVNRLACVVGPLIAAALVAGVGPAPALVADAVSFVLAAVIVGIGVPEARRATAADVPTEPEQLTTSGFAAYRAQLRSGAAYLRGDGLLTSISLMVAATNLLDQAMGAVLLPVWAKHTGGGPRAIGAVAAALAGTAVVGSLFAAWRGNRLPRRLTFTISYLLGGCPRYFALALGLPLWAVLCVYLVGGFGIGTINPIIAAVEVERVPAPLRGRVFALTGALSWVGIPFGGLIGGGVAEAAGLKVALVGCGVAYLGATLLPALRPEWRDMDGGYETAGARAEPSGKGLAA